MTMQKALTGRERDKFIETAGGDTAVRVELEAADIEIGAVEIKNATTDDRVNIELDNAKYAMYVQYETIPTFTFDTDFVHTIGGQDTLSVSIFHDVEVIQNTAADLNMTEANSGTIKTAIELVAGTVSGNELQVDILTMPDVDINDISKGTQTNDVKITLDGEQIVKTGDLIQVDHDYMALGYTGDNLTTITYKTGGSGGSTVATLTLAYTGAQLDTVTRT